MVALADMIVVLDNSYFDIFSWYACSLLVPLMIPFAIISKRIINWLRSLFNAIIMKYECQCMSYNENWNNIIDCSTDMDNAV